jgi:hypothetical protein
MFFLSYEHTEQSSLTVAIPANQANSLTWTEVERYLIKDNLIGILLAYVLH